MHTIQEKHEAISKDNGFRLVHGVSALSVSEKRALAVKERAFYFFPLSCMWQHWVNGILGLWVIIVPFLGLTTQDFMWTLVVTGLVIAVMGFWGAGEQVSVGSEQSHSHA